VITGKKMTQEEKDAYDKTPEGEENLRRKESGEYDAKG
jgi:hypothetical protein